MKFPALWAAVPAAILAASTAVAQQRLQGPACQTACSPAGRPVYTDSCEAAYYENKMWPHQYIGPSRRGICQATETMINKGWRRQNLLGKYHFDASGEQLSESGRLKVEWILTQAPAHRHTIYVERGKEQEQTTQRIQSVQDLAANMTPSAAADVQETYLRDEGHPAGAVDAVFTGFSANQMVPALPQSTSGSSSSGQASP